MYTCLLNYLTSQADGCTAHPPAYFIQLSGVGGHVSRGSRMRNLGIRKLSKIIKKKKREEREGNKLEERQVCIATSTTTP